MNIYISPHPDDAILSCGGRIIKESDKKQTVINVFTASYDGLTEWDRKCGLLAEPMKKRLKEDKRILSELGVKVINLDFHDAAVYSDLKGKKRSAERKMEIKDKLTDKLNVFPGNGKIFFPSGMGHVDHALLRDVGTSLNRKNIIFYEDIPYSINQRRKNKERYNLSREILNRKIDLIMRYKTQLPGLLELTNSETIKSFREKLFNLHSENGSFCERFTFEL